jgi:hypothetical protein
LAVSTAASTSASNSAPTSIPRLHSRHRGHQGDQEDLEITNALDNFEKFEALMDPTERAHLREKPSQAAWRLRAALGELAGAIFGLLLTLVGRFILAESMKVVIHERGEIPGTEISIRALERLLSGFFYRRILRQTNLLRMFGARKSESHEGDVTYGLALARRSYGGSYPGGVKAPRVRVALGVKVAPNGAKGTKTAPKTAPVWLVKRFLEIEPGRWRQDPAPDTHDSAEDALLSFYKDIHPDKLENPVDPVDPVGSANRTPRRKPSADPEHQSQESTVGKAGNGVWVATEQEYTLRRGGVGVFRISKGCSSHPGKALYSRACEHPRSPAGLCCTK